MKRFFVLLVSGLMAGTAFATDTVDGTMQFANTITSRIYLYNYVDFATNPVTSANLGSQTGNGSTGFLDVGLVWGKSANSVSTLAGIERIGTFPGILAGNANLPVVGASQGDIDYFQIFAWDSSYGDSLAGMNACIAAGGIFAAATGVPNVYGSIGAPLPFQLGPPLGPGTVMFSPVLAGYFHSFDIISTPEPGTISFLGLGAATLIYLRRQKQV